jgi:histone H3/H4
MRSRFLLMAFVFFPPPRFSPATSPSPAPSKSSSRKKPNSAWRQDAIETYKTTLTKMSEQVIKQAESRAKEENRTTILDRDIQRATDDVFRRSPLTVAELMEKIKQLSIIDLAALSNQVKAYGDDLLETKKKK